MAADMRAAAARAVEVEEQQRAVRVEQHKLEALKAEVQAGKSQRASVVTLTRLVSRLVGACSMLMSRR